jgi:hypothetical protein
MPLYGGECVNGDARAKSTRAEHAFMRENSFHHVISWGIFTISFNVKICEQVLTHENLLQYQYGKNTGMCAAQNEAKNWL